MVEQVAKYIRQWNMIEPGDTVIAGVSGGADSVCLCCVLAELSVPMEFTLRVVHVEHGIRGEESFRDADFVQQFCGERGIACEVRSVDVPSYAREKRIGEEEAARFLRYDIFRKEAAKYPHSKIALAHHLEDNAETILFQMARGSGLDGMCGIRPVRNDAESVTYIRPLLGVSRCEIEQELKRRGQAYCTDATNENLEYSRNHIRHRILPELKKVNAQAVLHMNRMAEQMNEIRDYMDQQLADAYEKIVSRGKADVVLHVELLRGLSHILQTRLVHNALAEAAGARQDLEAGHVEAVLGLMDKQSGRSVDLPYGLVAERSYDRIRLRQRDAKMVSKEMTEIAISAEILEEISSSGQTKSIKVCDTGALFTMRIFPFDGKVSEIPQKMYTKWLDYDKIKFGFSIRTRKNQDYFVMDAVGHRKKLSDYFINQKIPAEERDATLLIADGSQILWIVGGRMGRGAQLDGTSRMVLELIYEGGTRDGL